MKFNQIRKFNHSFTWMRKITYTYTYHLMNNNFFIDSL